MFICMHCGHHFDEPHNRYNRRWSDSDDSVQYCPNCGSEDFEEAGYCKKCDDYFDADSVVGCFCQKCLGKAETLDRAMKYGADRKQSVEINGLLAWTFSASEIEDILLRHFMDTSENWQKRRVEAYCDDDLTDFSDWLEEAHYDAE